MRTRIKNEMLSLDREDPDFQWEGKKCRIPFFHRTEIWEVRNPFVTETHPRSDFKGLGSKCRTLGTNTKHSLPERSPLLLKENNL